MPEVIRDQLGYHLVDVRRRNNLVMVTGWAERLAAEEKQTTNGL